uniref:Outer capsid glycoprotein VP7 n=1 Tax=Rotavirus A TaxID=28875 RepID=A0A2U9EX41_9REOV|nr:VP7 [Rotavirus A]
MYGIEYTTVLTFLISVVLLNYVHTSLNRRMDFIIYRFLLVIVILSPLLNARNYGINLPITGSMDTPYTNSTREEVFLTSTLCLYYPTEAATEINDNSWKDTLSQLFLIKGWPTGSIYFKDYTDIASFSVDPQLYCDYNLVLMKYDATLQLDMSELADLLLNEWLCNPMDMTLYYYQQTDEANQWISLGSSSTIKVCPLNTQTLGIGCLTTDTNTFEEVATDDKLVITDVVDGVYHKLNVTSYTCSMSNCKKLGPRENVAVIQVGSSDVLVMTSDSTTILQTESMMLVTWKKSCQVFYTIVDYVNQIVQAMSKRSRSLNSAAFYYRV